MRVDILAQMPDGNFVKMMILKADVVPNELVQIIVAYEAMADIVHRHEVKSLASGE
jgi:hypothetical protein